MLLKEKVIDNRIESYRWKVQSSVSDQTSFTNYQLKHNIQVIHKNQFQDKCYVSKHANEKHQLTENSIFFFVTFNYKFMQTKYFTHTLF